MIMLLVVLFFLGFIFRVTFGLIGLAFRIAIALSPIILVLYLLRMLGLRRFYY